MSCCGAYTADRCPTAFLAINSQPNPTGDEPNLVFGGNLFTVNVQPLPSVAGLTLEISFPGDVTTSWPLAGKEAPEFAAPAGGRA